MPSQIPFLFCYRAIGTHVVRLADSTYLGESVKHSFWARAYYEQQIAKGKNRRPQSARASLQVDQDHLEVLANEHGLQRSEVLGGLRKKGSPLLCYAAKNAGLS